MFARCWSPYIAGIASVLTTGLTGDVASVECTSLDMRVVDSDRPVEYEILSRISGSRLIRLCFGSGPVFPLTFRLLLSCMTLLSTATSMFLKRSIVSSEYSARSGTFHKAYGWRCDFDR